MHVQFITSFTPVWPFFPAWPACSFRTQIVFPSFAKWVSLIDSSLSVLNTVLVFLADTLSRCHTSAEGITCRLFSNRTCHLPSDKSSVLWSKINNYQERKPPFWSVLSDQAWSLNWFRHHTLAVACRYGGSLRCNGCVQLDRCLFSNSSNWRIWDWGSRGRTPRSWRYFLKIMHKWFVYWDFRQHSQHKKHFTTFPGGMPMPAATMDLLILSAFHST